jgi:hypothetical protein
MASALGAVALIRLMLNRPAMPPMRRLAGGSGVGVLPAAPPKQGDPPARCRDRQVEIQQGGPDGVQDDVHPFGSDFPDGLGKAGGRRADGLTGVNP